jgi:hypothetical protein
MDNGVSFSWDTTVRTQGSLILLSFIRGAETAVMSLSSGSLRKRFLHNLQFILCITPKSCASCTSESTSANSSIKIQFTWFTEKPMQDLEKNHSEKCKC